MDIAFHLDQIAKLEEQNARFLHLTAYENQMSETARRFLGSKLSERYYFGGGEEGMINWDPFTCLGMPEVEDLVSAAEVATTEMLHGSIANLKFLSGVHAMLCSILVATNPGDTVMIVHHDDGGHFSTQPLLEKTGRKVAYVTYDTEALQFDAAKTAKEFRQKKCTAIYLDISYCITPVNLRELRSELGDSATIIYDASHTVGLMMGGEFQAPLLEGADLLCANTHKTLPGPQKGLIVFRDEKWGKPLNDIINNGLFSSSHTHHLIALAISILEMKKFGTSYARQIIKNSNALGESLAALGYGVRRTPSQIYSETHQVHVFLPDGTKGAHYYRNLVKNGISTNFDDRIGKKLFIRLGTQEVTRRGMKEQDMKKVAQLVDSALKGNSIQNEVFDFSARFKKIHYSFDMESA
jgi:glycine hydroxymethyltransferase